MARNLKEDRIGRGAMRQRRQPQVRTEKFGCFDRSEPVSTVRSASFGDPTSEAVGVDLSEFVAEGCENLPLGIEGTNPSGQLFAMGDVNGPNHALDQRNLARDER
jgi:hypothetical protein